MGLCGEFFLFLFSFRNSQFAFFLPSAAGNEKDVLTYYRVLLADVLVDWCKY